jgi:hypothetical protein
VVGKEIKELVNSVRISAVQAGRKFTWIHARAEVLRSLTDIPYAVRFLALARLKRQTGTAAKLWISQVLTRKALLEDPKLPASITLPEKVESPTNATLAIASLSLMAREERMKYVIIGQGETGFANTGQTVTISTRDG